MRIDNAQIGRFLRDPGLVRVVLLYGDDIGMIRERGDDLTRAVAGSLDDPFRVVELTRDETGRLPDESISQGLTGGRRVVRLRETADTAAVLAIVQGILRDNGTNLMVLEGPGLPARGRLRTVLDAAPNGAAIGCYPEEGRALEETIRQSLAEARVAVDPDAMGWLSGHLGADRAATRAELEKLALYVGTGRRVDVQLGHSLCRRSGRTVVGRRAVRDDGWRCRDRGQSASPRDRGRGGADLDHSRRDGSLGTAAAMPLGGRRGRETGRGCQILTPAPVLS